MENINIVDLVVDTPQIELEDGGTQKGPTIYSMVVETAPNYRKMIDIDVEAYKDLHNFIYGEK